MMSRDRLLTGVVITALLFLAAASIAQTRTDVHPGKVQIRSTASDALVVLGGAAVSGAVSTNGVAIANTVASASWFESDAATDQKYSRIIGEGGVLSLQFVNDAFSAASNVFTVSRSGVTPTVMDIYPSVTVGGGTAFTKILSGSATWDPSNLGTSGGFDSVLLTVTGVTNTSPCFPAFSAGLGTSVVMTARYDTTNTVRLILVNTDTGSPYDPGSGTARATCFVY